MPANVMAEQIIVKFTKIFDDTVGHCLLYEIHPEFGMFYPK